MVWEIHGKSFENLGTPRVVVISMQHSLIYHWEQSNFMYRLLYVGATILHLKTQ